MQSVIFSKISAGSDRIVSAVCFWPTSSSQSYLFTLFLCCVKIAVSLVLLCYSNFPIPIVQVLATMSSDRHKRKLLLGVSKHMVDNDIKKIKILTDGVGEREDQESEGLEHVETESEEVQVSDFESEDSNDQDQLSDNVDSNDEYNDLTFNNGHELFNIESEVGISNDEFGDGSDTLSVISNDNYSSGKESEVFSEKQGLFSGSNVYSIALLSIMNKHSLTYAAADDILKLFAFCLPSPNYIPQSRHLLVKNDTILQRCCGYSRLQAMFKGRMPEC